MVEKITSQKKKSSTYATNILINLNHKQILIKLIQSNQRHNTENRNTMRSKSTSNITIVNRSQPT